MRDAPAYQEYAAAVIADMRFRRLSLPERGLLYTMRLECWTNRGLPAAPVVLAKVLGVTPDEIEHLLPSIMTFFKTEGEQIICPELEEYRARLDARRDAQARAAEMTNARRRRSVAVGERKDAKKSESLVSKGTDAKRNANRDANRDAKRTVDRTVVNINQRKPNQSKSQSLGKDEDSFVKDMEEAEQTNPPPWGQ